MKLQRTLAFTQRALAQFRHDRRTLAFILLMPLLMILIFGYTFGGDVQNVTVNLVNNDEGIPPTGLDTAPFPMGLHLGELVIDTFDNDTLILYTLEEPELAKQEVDKGKVWAAIIFPENFTETFRSYMLFTDLSARPIVEVYLDGSNPTIAGAVLKTVQQAIQTVLSDLAIQLNQTQVDIPIQLSASYAYGGGDIRFIDYFAPGVICFAIMMVTIMITIILFVNERRNGTLQRLLVSPASEADIVIGYALAFSVIGIFQSIVVLLAAILLFGITIVGNVLLALLVVLLLAFGHQGLGILLSAGARNELQAIQFIPLILFPSILLAGLFWPIESIPSYLQPLSYLIPLRYGIDAERSIMLRGWGIGEIWIDIVILIVFSLLTLGGSILLLKRRK